MTKEVLEDQLNVAADTIYLLRRENDELKKTITQYISLDSPKELPLEYEVVRQELKKKLQILANK